jgi:hypothetical protein
MAWDYTHNRPQGCSRDVDNAIHRAKNKYKLPRWFLYAVVHRESTFNPTYDPRPTSPTDRGVGLTQLTLPPNIGKPYPYGLEAPNNHYQQWIDDKGINNPHFDFGEWIKMAHVSRMTDELDPDQNLDRFHTVYAVPFYRYLRSKSSRSEPEDDNVRKERLKRLAFHWNQGIFKPYKSTESYLVKYDEYVAAYKPPVDSVDGVWDGNPGSVEVIFDDKLQCWADWSWGTSVNPNASSPVFADAKSMAVTYNQASAGLSLHHDGFNTTGYTHLKFVINLSGSPVPAIDASLYDSTDKPIKQVRIGPGPYITTSSKPDWHQVSIPLADLMDLKDSNRTIVRVQLQNASGPARPTFHIDDLKIVG